MTTDNVRYPELQREVVVGDIFEECTCGCVLVYDWEWMLKPCGEHRWKLVTP